RSSAPSSGAKPRHHTCHHTFRIYAGFNLVTGFASISSFPAIAFWHPDRFNGFAVGEFHQIPYGAVGRNELARNLRKPHVPALVRQMSAILERQRRDLIQPLNPLPVYGVE